MTANQDTNTNTSTRPQPNPNARPLLLSFDIEDWNQLIARDLGCHSWEREGGAAFERQMRRVLDLVDGFGVTATFFVLGVTAERHPDVLREIVARGGEVACHGYEHQRVFTQNRDSFRRDVERCVELVDRVTGVTPTGYRAPAFSITRDTVWALEQLAEMGFRYDTSLHDTPRVANRIGNIPDAPFRLRLPSGRELWEVPLPVARVSRLSGLSRFKLPVGGGTYWRVLPEPLLEAGLRRILDQAGSGALYFHPYEYDRERLRAWSGASPRSRARALLSDMRYNLGRTRVADRLRRVSGWCRLVSYGEAIDEFERSGRNLGSGPRSLSAGGVVL